MTTRTTFALLMAAGLAASPATAQDTGALTGGNAATRSPATSDVDAPPATNRGVIGNEIPGRGVVPPGISQPGELRAGMRPAMVAPGAGRSCRPTPASTRSSPPPPPRRTSRRSRWPGSPSDAGRAMR